MVVLHEIPAIRAAQGGAQVEVQLGVAIEAAEALVEVTLPGELAVAALQLVALAGRAGAVVGQVDRAVERPGADPGSATTALPGQVDAVAVVGLREVEARADVAIEPVDEAAAFDRLAPPIAFMSTSSAGSSLDSFARSFDVPSPATSWP